VARHSGQPPRTPAGLLPSPLGLGLLHRFHGPAGSSSGASAAAPCPTSLPGRGRDRDVPRGCSGRCSLVAGRRSRRASAGPRTPPPVRGDPAGLRRCVGPPGTGPRRHADVTVHRRRQARCPSLPDHRCQELVGRASAPWATARSCIARRRSSPDVCPAPRRSTPAAPAPASTPAAASLCNPDDSDAPFTHFTFEQQRVRPRGIVKTCGSACHAA
jgi:hypothetical protein